MALKLTKTEAKQRSDLIAQLREAAEDVDKAVNAANETIAELEENINGHITDYNDVVEKAREFTNGIFERLQSEFDEKSEGWQSSDAGGSVAQFMEAWGSAEIDTADEIDIDPIDEIATPVADALEELPDDVNS